MHLPDPATVLVDPAFILAAEDRRQRSARALAATAARYTDRQAETQARVRAAVLAYRATTRLPLDRLILDAVAPRPAA